MSLIKRNPPTEKQLAAYRANAAKSKGPVTPEGKRNSSANSRRYPNYFETVHILTDSEKTEYHEIHAELTAWYRPETEAAQHLVRIAARYRLFQLHYWRFETAIIDANKPCPGILNLLSRLDYSGSKRLNNAIMRLETGRTHIGMIEIAARTNYIVENTLISPEMKAKTEPIYPHFRRQRPLPKPNSDPISPEKTSVSHA